MQSNDLKFDATHLRLARVWNCICVRVSAGSSAGAALVLPGPMGCSCGVQLPQRGRTGRTPQARYCGDGAICTGTPHARRRAVIVFS